MQEQKGADTEMEYLADSNMSLMDKLAVLSDAAKYDVACTSSGVERERATESIWETVRREASVTASARTAGAYPY